ELEALGLTQIENANDIAVCNFASEDQLLFEAAKNFGIAGEVGADQLESDEALELDVVCLVDSAHAALAEQLQNFVAFRQQSADEGFALCIGGVGLRSDCDRPGRSSAG